MAHDTTAPSYFRPFTKTDIFRLDEGYSEETRSQADSEMRVESRQGENEQDGLPLAMQGESEHAHILRELMANLDEGVRKELAYNLIRSLRTSSIAEIVERLNPLLHIDPVGYLPPEVTFEIFSYLDPQTLLLASMLSKSWRMRALDSRLWRQQFNREGWVPDTRKVREYEADLRARMRRRATGKARARTADERSDGEMGVRSPKKRARDAGQFSPGTQAMNSPLQWAAARDALSEDSSMEGGVSLRGTTEDTEMHDAPPISSPLALSPTHPTSSLEPPAQPSLLLNPHTDPMVNWQYLYKQKRRLEANWHAGRFKNFQLPHPNHQDEAHAECVYTIQYSSTHLVSGSRDKTLRIWNLASQRLAVPPLRGHTASVLCLQFDDRPEHDLVVSGGSDCHVILWKFSTGKMLTKLERGHTESVLNLRFDDRYLITCSKDKTIKIWNRHALLPTDDAYPNRAANSASARFPAYIVDVQGTLEADLAAMKPLREYSLLATLEGHNAAVNAIQVLGSQIVSASGDRMIKIWDVKTGKCLKTIQGHQKGIACVQFDGKRIVSGSSDETVRIFDRVTGAEVACLKGHKNLVRTVQARFGDLPGSEGEDVEEARRVDREFFRAQQEGTLNRDRLTREQRRNRNAGGSKPDDLFAIGAKLPPGGGGSKWARIVSGSYDESVIIWRRDGEGKWVPARQLMQSEAVLAAGGQPRQATPQPPVQGPQNAQNANANANANAAGGQQAPAPLTFQQWLAANGHQLTPAQVAQMQAQMAHNLLLLNAQQGGNGNASANAAPHAGAAPMLGLPGQLPTGTAATSAPSTNSAQAGSAAGSGSGSGSANANASASGASTPAGTGSAGGTPTPQSQPQPSLAQQALQGAVPAQWGPALPHHPHAQSSTATSTPQAQPTASQQLPPTIQAALTAPPQPQAPILNPQPQPQPQPHHHHGHHHHHHHHAHGLAAIQQPTGANSRVFKLQFDSRRIICCSQDPTIVGWDFANGDAEIEEASRFFGEDF